MILSYTLIFIYNYFIFFDFFNEAESLILSILLTLIYSLIFKYLL